MHRAVCHDEFPLELVRGLGVRQDLGVRDVFGEQLRLFAAAVEAAPEFFQGERWLRRVFVDGHRIRDVEGERGGCRHYAGIYLNLVLWC